MSALQLAREKSAGSKHGNQSDIEAKAIPVDTHDVFGEEESGVDPVYQAKAHILNEAFQEIGMGRYQVCYMSLAQGKRGARSLMCPTVVPVHGGWVRMVLVSIALRFFLCAAGALTLWTS